MRGALCRSTCMLCRGVLRVSLLCCLCRGARALCSCSLGLAWLCCALGWCSLYWPLLCRCALGLAWLRCLRPCRLVRIQSACCCMCAHLSYQLLKFIFWVLVLILILILIHSSHPRILSFCIYLCPGNRPEHRNFRDFSANKNYRRIKSRL